MNWNDPVERHNMICVLIMTVPVLALLALTSCGEAASTWDAKRGWFVSTQELKEQQRREIRDLERRIERLEQR